MTDRPIRRRADASRNPDGARTEPEWETQAELSTGMQPDAVDALLAAHPRPSTRGECRHGPRPCPHVSCRYHLYLDVQENGRPRFNTRREVWDMQETCSLDVADRDETSREEVGRLLGGLTAKGVEYVEEQALDKLRVAKGIESEDTQEEACPSTIEVTALQAALRFEAREFMEYEGRWPTVAEIAESRSLKPATVLGILGHCPSRVARKAGDEVRAPALPPGERLRIVDPYLPRHARRRRARRAPHPRSVRGTAKAWGLDERRTTILGHVASGDLEAARKALGE